MPTTSTDGAAALAGLNECLARPTFAELLRYVDVGAHARARRRKNLGSAPAELDPQLGRGRSQGGTGLVGRDQDQLGVEGDREPRSSRDGGAGARRAVNADDDAGDVGRRARLTLVEHHHSAASMIDHLRRNTAQQASAQRADPGGADEDHVTVKLGRGVEQCARRPPA